MTTVKPYKHHKKGGGRHLQLQEWFQRTEAWATLKPGPRALYIELKRCFNGSNNGRIFLSYRDAAEALNRRKPNRPFAASLPDVSHADKTDRCARSKFLDCSWVETTAVFCECRTISSMRSFGSDIP